MSYLYDLLYHRRTWKELAIKFAILLAVSMGLNVGLIIILFREFGI